MLRPSPPRLGAQQHRHVRAETGDRGILFGAVQTSFEARERDAFRVQKLCEVIERIAVVDENQLLLGGISSQQIEQTRLLAAASQRRPSPRHRAPVRRVCIAIGEPRDGRSGRGRRGSRRAEQMLEGQAACAGARGRESAHRRRQFQVGRLLALRAVDPDRRCMTVRQLERHDRARVADHGVAHQRPQPFGIGGLPRLAGRHVGRAKLAQRLEDTGLEQREQVVELG
jgi:hypothetical protein